MKKIFALIIMAMLLMSLNQAVFSAKTITEQNSSNAIDVQAATVYTLPENMYSAGVTNKKAELSTHGGKIITVFADGEEVNKLTLNVIEIVKADADAYAWFLSVMKDISEEFCAFDIFFTDNGGNRVDVSENVKITITTPDGYKLPTVYQLSSDSQATLIASEQINGTTAFTATSLSRFAIANKTESGGTTDPSKPSDPTDPSAPPTADKESPLLFLSLAAATIVLTALAIAAKLKKSIEK